MIQYEQATTYRQAYLDGPEHDVHVLAKAADATGETSAELIHGYVKAGEPEMRFMVRTRKPHGYSELVSVHAAVAKQDYNDALSRLKLKGARL